MVVDDSCPLCSLFLDVVMMYLPSCLNSMMKKGLSSEEKEIAKEKAI